MRRLLWAGTLALIFLAVAQEVARSIGQGVPSLGIDAAA